jgi:sn1-specific diacylglycerol lipase
MPALSLFGRRWLISGDDVCFPAVQLATFHLVWCITLSIWLVQAAKVVEPCDSKPYYVGVVGSTLATCALSIVLEPAIAFYSSRGGMFETRRRSPALEWCIYADLLMSAFRVCVTGYGTRVLYAHPGGCLGDVDSSFSFSLEACYRAMLWSMWAMVGGLVCFCVLVYNWFPDFDDPSAWVRQFEYWSNWLCCVTGTRREVRESFRRMGELFGMVFGHVDLVPTDVITIFWLAMLRQRVFRLEEMMAVGKDDGEGDVEEGWDGGRHGAPARLDSRTILSAEFDAKSGIDSRGLVGLGSEGSETVGVEHVVIDEVAYYMRYAFAAYGWMLYVWAHPGSGVAKLCCGDSCRMCIDCASGIDGRPNGRNAKYLNREAILKTSGLEPHDLLHVQLEGDGKGVLPYFIGLDHAKKKLIIAIRGSLSFDDVVCDLKFDPVGIDEWLGSASSAVPGPSIMHSTRPTSHLAHRGIFEAAKATMASIAATGVVKKYLGIHPDYDILVCGHSLGAGCAFFVGMYLKQSHPTLRCMSYSPPGGLVSRDLAVPAADWCISTVCGKEWIPRLTLSTIERVRDEMVHLGIHCKMSKAKLFLSWMCGYLWSDEDIFHAEGALPEENARWLESYRQHVDAAATQTLRQSLLPAFDFHPPGRILYLRPTGETSAMTKRPWESSKRIIMQRKFVCEWTTGDRLVSNGILLSGRMMRDHFPNQSLAILRVLASGDGAAGPRKRKTKAATNSL